MRKNSIQIDFSEGGDTCRNKQYCENTLSKLNEKNLQIEQLEKKTKSLAESLSAEKHRCTVIANENTETVLKLTKKLELSQSSNQQQLQIDDLNHKCKTISCSFTDLEQQNDVLNAKLIEAAEVRSKLMSKLKTATNKFERAQKQKEKLNNEFSIEDNEKSRQIEELTALLTAEQEKSRKNMKAIVEVNNEFSVEKNNEVYQLTEENINLRTELDKYQLAQKQEEKLKAELLIEDKQKSQQIFELNAKLTSEQEKARKHMESIVRENNEVSVEKLNEVHQLTEENIKLGTELNKLQLAQKQEAKLKTELLIEGKQKSQQLVELNALLTSEQEKTRKHMETLVRVNNEFTKEKTNEVNQLTNESSKLRTQLDTVTNENGHFRNQLDGLTKDNCQLRSEIDTLTKDYDAAKIVITSKDEIVRPTKNDHYDASIKQRDTIIAKLEYMLSSEKVFFEDMLQNMQQQLTRLQQSEFNKNIEIESLKSERTKMITEIAQKNDQIALLQRKTPQLVNNAEHISSICAGIVNRAATARRLDAEISRKLQTLLIMLKAKQSELERQQKLIHILRTKQQQCRTIRVQQCERIVELSAENSELRERLRVNEAVSSICSAQMESHGSVDSCVVEDEQSFEMENNFNYGTYFREHRQEKRRSKIEVKKYYRKEFGNKFL